MHAENRIGLEQEHFERIRGRAHLPGLPERFVLFNLIRQNWIIDKAIVQLLSEIACSAKPSSFGSHAPALTTLNIRPQQHLPR